MLEVLSSLGSNRVCSRFARALCVEAKLSGNHFLVPWGFRLSSLLGQQHQLPCQQNWSCRRTKPSGEWTQASLLLPPLILRSTQSNVLSIELGTQAFGNTHNVAPPFALWAAVAPFSCRAELQATETLTPRCRLAHHAPKQGKYWAQDSSGSASGGVRSPRPRTKHPVWNSVPPALKRLLVSSEPVATARTPLKSLTNNGRSMAD